MRNDKKKNCAENTKQNFMINRNWKNDKQCVYGCVEENG